VRLTRCFEVKQFDVSVLEAYSSASFAPVYVMPASRIKSICMINRLSMHLILTQCTNSCMQQQKIVARIIKKYVMETP
jgi:hypothetical protein